MNATHINYCLKTLVRTTKIKFINANTDTLNGTALRSMECLVALYLYYRRVYQTYYRNSMCTTICTRSTGR